MRTLGKRVCSNAPRVRIPPHPPFRRQANLKLLGGMKSAAQRHRPTKGRPRRGEGRKPKSTFVVRAVRQVASRDQSLPIRNFAAGELEASRRDESAALRHRPAASRPRRGEGRNQYSPFEPRRRERLTPRPVAGSCARSVRATGTIRRCGPWPDRPAVRVGVRARTANRRLP